MNTMMSNLRRTARWLAVCGFLVTLLGTTVGFTSAAPSSSVSTIKSARLGDPFSGRIPRVGSRTFPTAYRVSEAYRSVNIRVRMTKLPYDVWVKAVRCGGGDVSSYPRFIPARAQGQLVTIASGVRGGTCFRLNFGAPTLNYFDVAGRVSYWP